MMKQTYITTILMILGLYLRVRWLEKNGSDSELKTIQLYL